jgi:hypothetical protein
MNCLLLHLLILTADPLGPGDHIRQITVDERERKHLVHVPKQYESKSPMAVILAFHGG